MHALSRISWAYLVKVLNRPGVVESEKLDACISLNVFIEITGTKITSCCRSLTYRVLKLELDITQM